MSRAMGLAVLTLMLSMLVGCNGGGRLTVRSQTEPGSVLESSFDNGIYRLDAPSHMTLLLFDGPLDNPTAALTIRLQWVPRAGRTPIDPAATNATVRYIVFDDDGETIGIYNGAGYVYPEKRLGAATMKAGVWQANLRLADRSPGFEDQLGQAMLEGRFTVRRDDAAVGLAMRKLTLLVRQRLGFPRMVMSK